MSDRLVQIERSRPRGEGTMDWSGVAAATRGDRPDLEVPQWDEPAADLAEEARRALYEVPDPEYPISLVDLGLIYDVTADDASGRVEVTMTFTATACPCIDFIRWDVRERIREIPGVSEVSVETVWDPPWTADRITDRGRRLLNRAGVSV